MKIRLAIIVIAVLIAEAHAQNQVDRVHLRTDVWERILTRLELLPERWDKLPMPIIPPSGRSPEQVLNAADEVEIDAATVLLSRLKQVSAKDRISLLAELRAQRNLTEVDLWLAWRITQEEELRSIDEAGPTLEAWLELAESLGRRDVLIGAAALAFRLEQLRISPTRLARAAEQWALIAGSQDARSAGYVNDQYGRILYQIGRVSEAVGVLGRARQLFSIIDDKNGLGHSWELEAKILSRLGRQEDALNAYRQARAFFAEIGSNRGQGNSWEGEARVLLILGKIQDSLAALQNAKAIFSDIGDKRGQGRSWECEARMLYITGRDAQSLEAYRKSMALFSDAGDRLGYGIARGGEGQVLFVLGRSDEALEAIRESRRIFSGFEDRLAQGNSWLNEATILYRLGQPKEALIGHRKARSFLAAVGDKRGEGAAWIGEADILHFLGKQKEALAAYRQGRGLFSAVNDKRGLGDSWNGEAEVWHAQDRYGDALLAYRQARTFYSALEDALGQGYSWYGEGRVLYSLGLAAHALAAFRRATILFAAVGDNLGQGNSRDGEGRALSSLSHTKEALAAHRHARSFFAAAEDKIGQGNSWQGEAEVLLRLGEYDAALTAYRQARIFYSAMGEKVGQSLSWNGEAKVLLLLNRLGPALQAAENAVQLAKKWDAPINEIEFRTREASILLASGRSGSAIDRARIALALIRRQRQQGTADIDRTAISNWSEPYDLLVPLLAQERGYLDEALALAEEAHAPVLLDLLATGSRRPEDTSDLSLREERKHLLRGHAELDRRLQDTIAPEEREKLRRQREALDAQLELNELGSLGSMDSTFVNGKPIDAKTRDVLVQAAGSILLYYVADDETMAFLLQPGQRVPLVRRIGLSRGQLQEEVRALRHELANPLWQARAHARQRGLFDQLVAPFAELLTATPRVTIIPHGPLHELPIEALLDADDRPLFERWHVTVAPSLSALHTLRHRHARRQPSPNQTSFLGIAGGTGLSLPYREVHEVGSWFGPTARIIAQHTNSRGAYAKLAPDARHILISSHGKHVAQSRSGYLELTAPDGVATRLTAGEIAHIPLRAELVTLAACETARGEAMQSDERLDLTRAFLIAGADAVVATRWGVPEHPSTRQFLLDFYQALHQGGAGGKSLRKDEALTEARRRSRARGDHAQLWAAWVLVGDAR